MKTNILDTGCKKIELKVVSRDFKITESIEKKIEETLNNLQKYAKHTPKVKMTLSLQKGSFVVKVLAIHKGKVLNASAESRDLYKSINLSIAKLKKQMKKIPTFIKGNEKSYKTGKNIKPNKKNMKSKIGYSKMRFLHDDSLKPMFKEEAEMQMKLSGLYNFHYIDAVTFEPAIVYNRKAS